MSTQTKHTPGPWEAIKSDGKFFIDAERSEENGIGIAATFHDEPWAEANARLIAAAPEMLAAVIEAHNVLEAAALCLTPRGSRSRLDSAIEQARAAIAKATGGAKTRSETALRQRGPFAEKFSD